MALKREGILVYISTELYGQDSAVEFDRVFVISETETDNDPNLLNEEQSRNNGSDDKY